MCISTQSVCRRGSLCGIKSCYNIFHLMDIYELQPDAEYQLLRDIVDFHGQSFLAGGKLTFVRRHFLPHDDGHTVVFKQDREFMPGSFREICMYLQGSDQKDIIENTGDYMRLVLPDRPSP
jgi:hypothetical protein